MSTRPGGTADLGGREVARIGYGAMQLHHRPESADAVLFRAVELCVDHVDTAHFYGPANELIRSFVEKTGADLAVVTKVGAVTAGSGLTLAQKPEQLREQVELNLATLGVDRLHAVNLRRGDMAPGLIAEGDQLVDLDDQLAELVALREEGKLAGIGLSHVSADQIRQALPVGPVCVQNADNVLYAASDEAHAVCREHGIAWVPFFPLGSAFEGFPTVGDHPVVIAEAARLGCTPAQLALAWLLDADPRCLLIPGTASPEHLAENVAAGAVTLDGQARRALDTLSR